MKLLLVAVLVLSIGVGLTLLVRWLHGGTIPRS